MEGRKVNTDLKELGNYSKKDLMGFYTLGYPVKLRDFYEPLVLSELFRKTEDSELAETINLLFRDVNYNDLSSLGTVKLLVNAAAIADFGWDFYRKEIYENSNLSGGKSRELGKYMSVVNEYFFSMRNN